VDSIVIWYHGTVPGKGVRFKATQEFVEIDAAGLGTREKYEC
jgi:hypothetical protein